MENSTGRETPLLKVENLNVIYGRTWALKDVSFELSGGNLVGIIGPNGAGKSSLLKGLLGIVSHGGTVLVSGQPLAKARKRVAFVPQREEVRWDFPVTVWDVVMMGRYPKIGWVKLASKKDFAVVEASLKKVNLLDLQDRQISQLSGGQQQRVFMARALAQEGDIIILDEPLTGVDIASEDVILGLLKDLTGEGKLVVMATHDLDAAARCDLVGCINRGLVALGPPSEIFIPEVLAKTYGGHVVTLGNTSGTGNSPGLGTIIIDSH